MKVLLLDLDVIKERRPFPNLALMKLSAFYKAKGNGVFLNFPLQQADIVYASCVFSWNSENTAIIPENATIGGYGFKKTDWLPSEIEHIKPDYSLYPAVDFSMGFTSRGCIRHCAFCLVPEKEGTIQAWTSPYEFYEPRFKKILLLDNNILAAPNWKETLTDLIKLGVEVDFNQGLDIRLLDDEKISFLKRVRVKQYRFAFDSLSYELAVRSGIEAMLQAEVPKRKMSFYVLAGLPDDGAIERLKILQSFGVEVYPMIYKGEDGEEPKVQYSSKGTLYIHDFHGGRGNLRKFLRIAGRI